MKRRLSSEGLAMPVGVGMLLVASQMAQGANVLSDSPRQNIKDDVAYVVTTAKVGDGYPIATRPQFAFDCSQRDGWTIDAQNRVSRVPDLGGGDRYITSVGTDIKTSNYSYNLWYNKLSRIQGPELKMSDGVIKGPYLDFGLPGSYCCLFFDPSEEVVSGDVTNYWNKLTHVGTVIGVYKPYTGACAAYPNVGDQAMGGQLLGGQDFLRHGVVTTYGIHESEPILYRNVDTPTRSCAAVKLGGKLYKDRQAHDAGNGYAYWNPGWEVIAFNPSDATTLETHGVGVGDCHNCDFSRSCGGQAIAELMIFDTVLSEEDVLALIAYLDKKWLGHVHDGEEGTGRVAALNLSDAYANPGVGKVATVDVPSGETLVVDQMRGGRSDSSQTLPSLVKTGAGTLTVNDAANFGGDVKIDAGTLAFSAKPVPTFDQLPKGMAFRLDASDTSTMLVEADGTLSQWTNALWSTRQVRAYQTLAYRRPKLVADALGPGLNVVDFGSRNEATQAYLALSPVLHIGTVFAVVDARIQGGGHLTENIRRLNNWSSRERDYTELFFATAADRAAAQAWVNGRHNDMSTEAYEVPAFQVLAMRLPPHATAPSYLGARTPETSSNAADSGGFRLAEFITYERTLTEGEIRDVSAYLMKKWFQRSAPGYEKVSTTDVADLQRVVAAAGTVIDVPAGTTQTIARLTTSGTVVKTGAGRLLLGNGSDLSGGLVVREGSVGRTAGAVAVAGGPAKDPILHLDATKADTRYTWLNNGTNYVAAWQSPDGRSGAYTTESSYNRLPFLNTWDTLNGHPVIDFGKQVDDWSNKDGAYLKVAPEVRNLRAAYVVYGSQAKGGQIFGSWIDTTSDMSRSTTPTLDTGLFNAACNAFLKSAIYTNGVLIAGDQNHRFKPTGGYQLIEFHTVSGMRFSTLASGAQRNYLYGGNRMGEVIVYERPLSDREKVATRNYLLQKWFPDTPCAALPDEPEVEPMTGDFGVSPNGTWDVAVRSDGTAEVISVTGTVSFGAGSVIRLTGVSAFTEEQLKELRIVIARAAACQGVANVSFETDAALGWGMDPHLVTRSNGDLVVRFGHPGLMLMVR